MKRARELAEEIIAICESVDGRCLASDGPVSNFRDEATDIEIDRLAWLAYRLAKSATREVAPAKRRKKR